jgi:hypothetical protein
MPVANKCSQNELFTLIAEYDEDDRMFFEAALDPLDQYSVSQTKPPKPSGQGTIQGQILDKLRNQRSYASYHALRWDIAGDRGVIEMTGLLCPKIETGYIKRSFIQTFQRAIKRLGETGQIEIEDDRVTNLDEALGHFPYHTCKLELRQLRKELLPSIAEYIHDMQEPSSSNDVEKVQLSKLRMAQDERFTNAREMWKEIQKTILLMLKHRDTDMHDEWLLCLVRGRYLFLENKLGHPKLLVTFCDDLQRQKEKTEIEERIVGQLRRLIDLTFTKGNWELRNAYNEIHHFMKDYRENLKCEVKHYLREKHKDLIISLPGHEEPEDTIYPDMEGIRYSGYLDELVTRKIFQKHRRIKAL